MKRFPEIKSQALNAKGFTIVELVMVIAILGILASFAVPNYLEMAEEVKEAKMRYTFQQIITTLVMCQSLAQTAGADLTSYDPVSVDYEGTPLTLRYGLPTGTQLKTLMGGMEGYYTIDSGFYLIVYPEQGDYSGIILYRQFPNQPLWLYVDGSWERRW